MESAWPRTIEASRRVILRAGSGSRALPGARPGRSAANVTSSSGVFAIARRQAVTARLNGSGGASFPPGRKLEVDVVIAIQPLVPTKAEPPNHQRSSAPKALAAPLRRDVREHGSRLALAFARLAGATTSSGERHVDCGFRKLRVETTLVKLSHQR